MLDGQNQNDLSKNKASVTGCFRFEGEGEEAQDCDWLDNKRVLDVAQGPSKQSQPGENSLSPVPQSVGDTYDLMHTKDSITWMLPAHATSALYYHNNRLGDPTSQLWPPLSANLDSTSIDMSFQGL